MTYDFDHVPSRWNTNSYKYDSAPNQDVIPMWVADMDFPTAPVVQEAIRKRSEHPIYGYVKVPESYYQSTINWFSHRHGWFIPRDAFIYTSGVVPAISAIIQGLTQKGDKVLVQTPVYNCFFSSIRNSGCEIACSSLNDVHAHYEIDFKDFEDKCADEKVKIFLLCNPHNPVGRVWTREELRKMGEICLKYHVFVISDEIHCELTFPGQIYTPFASISEEFMQNSATCISPSKAFNIAGLQIANIIVADEQKRKKVDKAININEVCDVNPFGVTALQAAYTPEGEEWLSQLNAYIEGNYQALRTFFKQKLPQYSVTEMEGTYLAWVNVCQLPSEYLCNQVLLLNHKVWVSPGCMYAQEHYIRINMACPRATLLEGLNRIKEGLNTK